MRYLLALLLLAGAAVAQDAKITIVNDSTGGGWNFHPPSIKVLDGGKDLAKVENHAAVTVSVPAGVHGLALSFKKKQPMIFTAEAGKSYVVLVYLHQGAARSDQGVRLLNETEAAYYLKSR